MIETTPILEKMHGDKEDMMNYESVNRWITQQIRRSASYLTRNNYLRILIRYCKWYGKDPDEIIDDRMEDLKSDDKRIQSRHEERLMKYFQELDEDVSRNTAITHFNSVKSFYMGNYAPLNIREPKRWTTFTDKVPTLCEFRKMVEVAESPMQKALLLFSAQSGQRGNIISSLRYGMLEDTIEGRTEVPATIHIPGGIENFKGKMINKNRKDYYFGSS